MTKKRPVVRREKGRPQVRSLRSVVWTNRALSDLESIGDYIARDNPNAAAHWVRRLLAAAENASAAPLAGRRVPELAREEVREVFLRSYRIVYRIATDHIEVITVFEGHRLFPDDVDRPPDES